MAQCPGCAALVTPEQRFCPACGAALASSAEDQPTVSLPTSDDAPAPSGRASGAHGRFVPGEMLGTRYRIVGLLGVGGMGEVYRADDLDLEQSVALKFLPERLATDPVALDRFRREVRTARDIAHPNVCRVYDIAEIDGNVFLCMEYIDGDDLAHVLKRLGRPSPEKSIEIARQLCLGLASAHENGVLHRDLKPHNVMIDGRGRVRITDFGLAGLADELKASPSRAGTPAYMAPEQLESGAVSMRSDIYSLGLVLFELFTGKRAFEGETLEEIRTARSSGTISRPSSILDDLDPSIERAYMGCLELEPADRPSSVYEVLGALPGGDPLAAALAAGETPSPQLLANTRESGALRPAIAVSLALFVVMSMIGIALAGSRWMILPSTHPDELSVRAGLIVEQLAPVGSLPPISVDGFERNEHFGPDADGTVDLGAMRPYRFWRRWSHTPLRGSQFHNSGFVTPVDPPMETPGDVVLVTDDEGRLVEMHVFPDDDAPDSDLEATLRAAFVRAGLDFDSARGVESSGAYPIACRERLAWRIADKRAGEITVRAGTAGGQLVFFDAPDLTRGESPIGRIPEAQSMGVAISMGVFITFIWFGAVFLAWRNIRRGRGDRRSAFRFAMLMFFCYALKETITLLITGDISPGSIAGLYMDSAAGHMLIHAVQVWIAYLAIEPYARRLWPRALVGWVRALDGRIRDPRVGREMLVGLAAGIAVALLISLGTGVTVEAGLIDGDPAVLTGLQLVSIDGSLPRFILAGADAISGNVLGTLIVALLLLVCRLIFRHPSASALIAVTVYTLVLATFAHSFGFTTIPIALVVGFLWSALVVGLFVRVGLLAVFVCLACAQFLGMCMVTADLTTWHGARSGIALAIVIVCTAWAAYVSLGGQAVFRDILDEGRTVRG